MKLIIDIPDEKYNWICNTEFAFKSELNDVIRNGKPLPKHCGRLISETELCDIIERMWKNKQITNTKYNTFLQILDYVPTILEKE